MPKPMTNTLKNDESCCCKHNKISTGEKARKQFRLLMLRAVFGVIPGLVLLGLTASGFILPLITMYCVAAASVPLMLFVGWPIYQRALSDLKNKRITMDTLFALSTMAAWTISMLSLFVPILACPAMFEVGLLILGFRNLGLAIETKLEHHIIRMTRFRDRLPKEARIVENNQESQRALKAIRINDTIIVRKGEMIPLDATVISGEAKIENTINTGDFTKQTINKGSHVTAGMKVIQGELTLLVTATVENSLLAKLDRSLETESTKDSSDTHSHHNHKLSNNKTHIEELANQIIRYFIPAVVGLALVSGLLLGFLVSPVVGLCTALCITVASCPCVLGFIIPLATKVARSKGAEHSVFVRDPTSLQTLAKIDTLVLDKTGTMTHGEPRIAGWTLHDKADWDKHSVFSHLLKLEENSQHPVAKAIKLKAKEMGIASQVEIQNQRNYSNGIEGLVDEKRIVIGNRQLMEETLKIHIPKSKKLASNDDYQDTLYFAVNNSIVATLHLRDTFKPDAKRVITELKKYVKNIIICTGSDSKSAKQLAHQLEIPDNCIYAQHDSLQKAALIKRLKADGKRVAMVGDRENDALALEASDVSFVMQSGDEISQQEASIMLGHKTLQPLLSAFRLSKQTMTSIKQSLAFTFAYNASMLGLILTGIMLNPGLAAMCMLIESSIVLVNIVYLQKKRLLPKVHSVSKQTGKAEKSTSPVRFKTLPFAKTKTCCAHQHQTQHEQAEPLIAQLSLRA